MTTIRPMTAADVAPAAEMILAAEWGDRREFFAFAAGHAECRPIVAASGSRIVGTGVGTLSGRVGWVGAIFVAPSHRRRGLGVALTDAVIDGLAGAGARTLVLVATAEGRPIYERLGFEVVTHYHTFEAPGTGPAADPAVRPFVPADLQAIVALDRAATGEDRSHLLRSFASPASTRIVDGPHGPAGFVVRAPWGGGATVAPSVQDAVALLEARRAAAGPSRRVRAGLLAENVEGRERLARLGWDEAWRAPRLVRGEPLDWRPESIWGQFNHAIG